MDEPCSALDPIATTRIEDLIHALQDRLHDRDRHAQHAAGCTRGRHDRVLPRCGAGRGAVATASSSSTTRRTRCSPIRPTSGQRTTSPGGSGRPRWHGSSFSKASTRSRRVSRSRARSFSARCAAPSACSRTRTSSSATRSSRSTTRSTRGITASRGWSRRCSRSSRPSPPTCVSCSRSCTTRSISSASATSASRSRS